MAIINQMSAWYNTGKQGLAIRFPRSYQWCERHKGVIKFLLAGLTAAAVNLLVLDLLYRIFSWPIIPATSIAFLVAFFVSFSLQKFWTFRDKSRDRISKQLLGYLANGLVGLYLNGWLMKLLVEDYALWHLLAQILVSAVIALQNFLVYRIIFKKHHEDSGQ